jgi:hypothetical protein
MSLDLRIAWATRLGLLEGGARGSREGSLEYTLRMGARSRALSVLDAGHMRRMLGWVQDFVDVVKRWPLFHDLTAVGDVVAGRYNALTLTLVGEFVRESGSKKRGSEGKLLRADGIQSVVTTARQVREIGSQGAVADASLMVGTSQRFKAMRREDGAPGSRDSRRAMRARHFVHLAEIGWDRFSPVGEMEWAVGLTAHNAILRGGEVGRRDMHTFDPGVCLTLRSVVWCLPCPDSRGRLWLILWVVPIKDQNARHQAAVPIPIVRRQTEAECAEGADPLCTYDAIARVWRRRMGKQPPSAAADWSGRVGGGRLATGHPKAQEPLFRLPGGGAWSTTDVRALAQRWAAGCGEDPAEFGAKSWRAGGATDLRIAVDDDAKSANALKERGRWASDVALIYQRSLLRTQLDASSAMGHAAGVDLEAVCLGWSQPTTVRAG